MNITILAFGTRGDVQPAISPGKVLWARCKLIVSVNAAIARGVSQVGSDEVDH
jgi:hypothetical protein